jgi:hypothetical protein
MLNVIENAQQCKAQIFLTNQRTGVNVVNSSQTETRQESKKTWEPPNTESNFASHSSMVQFWFKIIVFNKIWLTFYHENFMKVPSFAQ